MIPKLPPLSPGGDIKPEDDIKQLRIALAQVRQNPTASERVIDHLSLIEEQHGKPYIRYLSATTNLSDEMIASKAKEALEQNRPESVFLAALLCSRNPNHETFDELLRPLCVNLLRKSTVQLPLWIEHFQPIQNKLVDELIAIGEERERESAGGQDLANQNLAVLVTALASSDSKSLSRALTWIPVDSMPALVEAGRSSKDFALELRELLAKESTSFRPKRQTAPQALEIERDLDGQIYESGAWLERIPFQKLDSCVNSMK